jgi:coenzyme F420-reducing hydrogenase delta subunit/Pyruvate/2-oxoacid:ferredoxin oxidoreductase delta subunit
MMVNPSADVNRTMPSDEAIPKALVMGGGMSALIAAQALAETGVHVTLARFHEIHNNLYLPAPASAEIDEIKRLNPDSAGVEIIDVERAPMVSREQGFFKASFADVTESVFDAVLLAPSLALMPKPTGLPEEVELFSAQTTVIPGRKVCFVMDYQDLSHPILGMSAIQIAAQNVRDGGESMVCFKHAPVLHMFGETAYDSARKAGVLFVRYGEAAPTIQQATGEEGQARFRVTVKDVVDSDNDFAFGCDRIVAVTGPDPSSIPEWAVKIAHGDVDDRGFMLSESIHCHSGSSFTSGVFAVGEATGNLDLITGNAQARAAAAHAKAWIEKSRSRRDEEILSVSTACVRCLTCFRVCPHAAISLLPQTSRSRVEPSSSFCHECGICAAVCPSSAISMTSGPENSSADFIKNVDPSEISKTTFVFGCQRSAGVMTKKIDMPERVEFLAVPCAGSVSEHAIWSTLAVGAKGVLVVGCHHGNCASHRGTELAAARVRRGRQLGVFGGELPRIGYLTVAPNEEARFLRLLNEFHSGHGE